MGERHLPLRARDGTVRAWVIVDQVDFVYLSRWRWALSSGGYAVRKPSKYDPPGARAFLHREVLDRMGHVDAPMGDHINRDKLDCRRVNLRPADAKLNAANRPRSLGRKPWLPEPLPRPCRHCGATFVPRRKSPGRIYCSVNCQRAAVFTHDSETQRARTLKRWAKTQQREGVMPS